MFYSNEEVFFLDHLIFLLPSPDMKSAALDYQQEHLLFGETELHGSALMDALPYEEWLQLISDNRSPATVHSNWVTADTYFVLRKSDRRLIGMADIRHSLDTPFLSQMGGHIGYGVRPSERRKGYAATILQMALDHARSLRLSRVMLSCYSDNEGSSKTILKGGGKKEQELFLPNGKTVEIYWIEL